MLQFLCTHVTVYNTETISVNIVLIDTCGHWKHMEKVPNSVLRAEYRWDFILHSLQSPSSLTLPSLPLPSSSSLFFLSFCFYSSRLLYKGNTLFLNSYYLVFLQPTYLLGCVRSQMQRGVFTLSGGIFCHGAAGCPSLPDAVLAHAGCPSLLDDAAPWAVGAPGRSLRGSPRPGAH